MFMYQDPIGIISIVSSGSGIAGFDAGDERRSVSVPILEETNVFRIDGMYIHIIGEWYL